MVNNMRDRRSERTRAALHGAFVDLLLEHGYEALRIEAIAARANVGRSTFYEHYRTKHDLLQASIARPFSVLAELVDPACPIAPAIALLRHFRDHQQVARVLLGWPTRPLLGHTLSGLVADRLKRRSGSAPRIPFEVAASQIAAAQLALVDMWLQGRPGLDTGIAAEALRRACVLGE